MQHKNRVTIPAQRRKDASLIHVVGGVGHEDGINT